MAASLASSLASASLPSPESAVASADGQLTQQLTLTADDGQQEGKMLEDDFGGSSDEVKIFKDEGEEEEKEFGSHEELQAALSEDKSSLIQETELSIKQEALRLNDSGKLRFWSERDARVIVLFFAFWRYPSVI